MRLKQTLILLIIIFSCKPEKLIKLTHEQAFARAVEEVKRGEYTSLIEKTKIKDNYGNIISYDSMNNMISDSTGLDYYIDENDHYQLIQIRPIVQKDIEANNKWDSLLTFDHQFLLEFANQVAKDSTAKQGIINAYKQIKQSLIPLQTFSVNCDSIFDYLNLAFEADQRVRTLKQHDLYLATDRKNQEILLSIIECCNVESIADAGNEAVKATFMIIQHSNIEMQKKYFPTLEKWSLQGLLKQGTLALMIDRILTGDGEKQIFGSQVRRNNSDSWELLPIEHPERVNILRDSVGLEPLADYLSRFGIEY